MILTHSLLHFITLSVYVSDNSRTITAVEARFLLNHRLLQYYLSNLLLRCLNLDITTNHLLRLAVKLGDVCAIFSNL